MKRTTLLTTLFLFLGFWGFGQVTGDINQDTLKANQLLEEAILKGDIFLEGENDDLIFQVATLAKEAEEIYRHYGLLEKRIIAKGYFLHTQSLIHNQPYANEIYEIRDSAKALIELAKKHFNNDKHPSLKFAYLTLTASYTDVSWEKLKFYGEITLNLIEKPSIFYFKLVNVLGNLYLQERQYTASSKLLEEAEYYLNNDAEGRYKDYYLTLYYKKLEFHSSRYNYEKAVIYGEKAILEYKKGTPFNIHGAVNFYVLTGLAYGALDQYDKGLALINQGVDLIPSDEPDVKESYNGAFATFYHNKKDYKKAIEYYKKQLDFFLTDEEYFKFRLPAIYFNIAFAHYQMREFEEALTMLKPALELSDDMEVKFLYAKIIGQLGEHNKALDSIQHILIDLVPNFKDKNIDNMPNEADIVSDLHWMGNILRAKGEQLFLKGIREKSAKALENTIKTNEFAIKLYARLLDQMQGYESTKINNSLEIRDAIASQLNAYYHLYLVEKNQEVLENYYY